MMSRALGDPPTRCRNMTGSQKSQVRRGRRRSNCCASDSVGLTLRAPLTKVTSCEMAVVSSLLRLRWASTFCSCWRVLWNTSRSSWRGWLGLWSGVGEGGAVGKVLLGDEVAILSLVLPRDHG